MSCDLNEILPRDLEPTHYRIKIIPNLKTLETSGVVRIQFIVKNETNKVIFNISNIIIMEESVKIANKNTSEIHKIVSQSYLECCLYEITLQNSLKIDEEFYLDLAYTGELNKSLQGFYKMIYLEDINVVKTGASTQFSPTDARKAFPCFDEPFFKAKFTLSIARPSDMITLSNMVLERSEPIIGSDNYVWDHYPETPKMPTYIVGFMIMTLKTKSDMKNLIRIWSREILLDSTQFATDLAPKILKYLEDYFDIKYPLPKMDLVAVPEFGFSAMENYGMITFSARKWLIACHREDLFTKIQNIHNLSYRLCSKHFDEKMFVNLSRKRLFKKAYPVHFLSMEGSSGLQSIAEKNISPNVISPTSSIISPAPTITPTISSPIPTILPPTTSSPTPLILSPGLTITPQTPTIVSPSPSILTPTKTCCKKSQTTQTLTLKSQKKRKEDMLELRKENKRLKKEVEKLKKVVDKSKNLENVTLEDYKKLTNKFCTSPSLAQFVNVQASQISKNPKGRRYTKKFKNYCLGLYFQGPKSYKNKLVKDFCLPSLTNLRRFIENTNFSSGVNDDAFKIFEKKVKHFSNLEKICMVCVDEISLEDSGGEEGNFQADINAMVVMIRGLYSNWKQPISYLFVDSICPANKLKDFLFSIIEKLQKLGLNILSLVCDMSSNNIQLSKMLGISPEQPFFECGSNTISFIFDVPHLLKSLKNNLIKYDFFLYNKLVSWKYIKSCYDHDKQYSIRAVPQLTDSHFSPSCSKKMEVKYAAQIFSSTLSTCMNLYIRFEQLPAEAEQTQLFIKTINDLFDFLNSSKKLGRNRYQNAYKFSKEDNELLLEYFNLFDTLKIFNSEGDDVTSTIKCIKGWKISIQGFLKLGELAKTNNMNYLLTRRLNQDCLKDFFGVIRQQCGNTVNPTSIQFSKAFRKLFYINIMHSGNENCQKDESTILMNALDIMNANEIEEVPK